MCQRLNFTLLLKALLWPLLHSSAHVRQIYFFASKEHFFKLLWWEKSVSIELENAFNKWFDIFGRFSKRFILIRHLIKKGGTTRFQASCDKGEAYLDSFLPYWASLTKRATLKSLVTQAPVWLVLKTVDINRSKNTSRQQDWACLSAGHVQFNRKSNIYGFPNRPYQGIFFQPLVKRN